MQMGFRAAVTMAGDDLNFSPETRGLQAEMCVWKQVAYRETGVGPGDSAAVAAEGRGLPERRPGGGAQRACLLGTEEKLAEEAGGPLGTWGGEETDIGGGGGPSFRTGSVRASRNVGLKGGRLAVTSHILAREGSWGTQEQQPVDKSRSCE